MGEWQQGRIPLKGRIEAYNTKNEKHTYIIDITKKSHFNFPVMLFDELGKACSIEDIVKWRVI